MLTFQPRRLLRGIKELPFPVWLRSHKGSPCARLEFTAAAAPGPGMTRDTAGQGHTKRRALLPSPGIIYRERFLRIKGRDEELGWRFRLGGFLAAFSRRWSPSECVFSSYFGFFGDQSGHVRFPE